MGLDTLWLNSAICKEVDFSIMKLATKTLYSKLMSCGLIKNIMLTLLVLTLFRETVSYLFTYSLFI
jgi:hypothetical protein